MKYRETFAELLLSFCVCTACITILEGVIGAIFYPTMQLNYYAFFSPPLFGLFSVVLGCVTWSKKELTVKQVLLRRGIHLLLIEGMVFGINYFAGTVFSTIVNIVLALGIAVVFVLVYVILWMNDQKSAKLFNEKLKEYQAVKTML